MSSIVPPAASTAALMFSQTWRVCSSTSPIPAIVPSALRAVMPEMKTMRPWASMAVAWENTPGGVRSFSLRTSCFDMRLPSPPATGGLVAVPLRLGGTRGEQRLEPADRYTVLFGRGDEVHEHGPRQRHRVAVLLASASAGVARGRSEAHTSELQSRENL